MRKFLCPSCYRTFKNQEIEFGVALKSDEDLDVITSEDE